MNISSFFIERPIFAIGARDHHHRGGVAGDPVAADQ